MRKKELERLINSYALIKDANGDVDVLGNLSNKTIIEIANLEIKLIELKESELYIPEDGTKLKREIKSKRDTLRAIGVTIAELKKQKEVIKPKIYEKLENNHKSLVKARRNRSLLEEMLKKYKMEVQGLEITIKSFDATTSGLIKKFYKKQKRKAVKKRNVISTYINSLNEYNVPEIKEIKVKQPKSYEEIDETLIPMYVEPVVFANKEYTTYSMEQLGDLYKNLIISDNPKKLDYCSEIVSYLIQLYVYEPDEKYHPIFCRITELNKTRPSKEEKPDYLILNKKIRKAKKYFEYGEFEHNYMWDILLVLMNNEEHIDIIQNIIIKKGYSCDIYNLRNDNGKHLLFEVLEKLFNSIDVEMENHTRDYVKKEFFVQIIKIFINSNKLDLTKEEKKTLERMQKNYLEDLMKRKNSKLADMITVVENVFVKDNINEKTEEEDYRDFSLITAKDKDVDEHIISFESNEIYNPTAYSAFEDEKGLSTLRIYIADATKCINGDTKLFELLRNNPNNSKILSNNKFYAKLMDLNKEETKSVIAFEFKITSYGRLLLTNVYKDSVKVDEVVSFGRNRYFSEEAINSLSVIDKMIKRYGSTQRVKEFLNHLLTTHMPKELPLVYRTQDKEDYTTSFSAWTEISLLLLKIHEKDAGIIIQTLNESYNLAYFSEEKCRHQSLDRTKLDLLLPVNNYYRLLNQINIIRYYIDNLGKVEDYQQKAIEELKGETAQVVDELNKNENFQRTLHKQTKNNSNHEEKDV